MKTSNLLSSLSIVLFIFLLNTCPINAQTTNRYTEPVRELFYPVQQPSLSKTITSLKIQQRLDNKLNKEVRYGHFTNFNDIAEKEKLNPRKEKPYFSFSISDGERTKGIKNILAIPTHIEFQNKNNYIYYADLVYGRHGAGSLILIYKDGHSFGSFKLGNRHFKIESLSENLQLIIELDNELVNSELACGVDSLIEMNSKDSMISQAEDKSTSCTSKVTRVLVMYTAQAEAAADPSQAAYTYIAETNEALRNSTIFSGTFRYQLTDVIRINSFNERNDNLFESILNDLDDLVINPELNEERQNYNADIVVVLTDANYYYGSIFGIAGLNEYKDRDLGHVAISEIDVDGYTFSHEVGHLMGCRHDTDQRTGDDLPSNLSETAKGHSWFYRNWFLGRKHYQKSVMAVRDTEGTRVKYYSNPSVKAHKKARDYTGTSTRNNYQQIKEAASVVSCYDPFEEMSISISGAREVDLYSSFTLHAVVSNCSEKTYHWETSTNGYTYYRAGTESSYTGFLTSDLLFIRLTVNCSDGQTKTAYSSIYANYPGDGDFPEHRVVRKDKTDKKVVDSMVMVYPNAASDNLYLTSNFSEPKIVRVEIHSILTLEKTLLLRKNIESEPQKQTINISKMQQGLYEIKVFDNNKEIFSTRVLIHRKQ